MPGGQQKRPIFPARYGVADRVRVKSGTTDPDFPDIPLGGWAGTISEVDQRSNPPSYLIEWDRRTLDHMHPVYRKRCERDSLDLASMWLEEADLEPDSGGPAVVEQPTSIVTRPLSKENQDDRIRAIFGFTSDDPLPPADEENLRRYNHYLATHLAFPFQARCPAETGPFERTEYIVSVVDLLDADACNEDEGVLCEAEQQGETVELPLADLNVTINLHNRQLVEDYSYWFGNRSAEDFTAPADGHGLPFDTLATRSRRGGFVRALAKCGLYGAVYGVVLGSLLGAVEGTVSGAWVAAVIVGFVGCVAGAKYGRLVGVMNRIWYGSLAGGILGTVVGVLVGAMIGAMVVAFIGTLVGGIVGALVGRLLAQVKWTHIGSFKAVMIGSGAGAVVLACNRDQKNALVWGYHGAWLGAGAGVLLALATFGSLILAARNRH